MKDKYLEFYKTNFGTAKYCTKSWGLASFEAGAQSRQPEIDDLVDMVKTPADSEMYLYDALQKATKERNELQKRVDNLTNTNESLVAYKNQLLDDSETQQAVIDELKAQLKAVHDSRAEFVEYCRMVEAQENKR